MNPSNLQRDSIANAESNLTALLIYFNIHLRRQIPHNDIQRIVAAWGASGSATQGEAHYPTDFSRDVIPIPCHSHNDYWRKVPLYDALAVGCTGVEADVWLTDDDNLLVGHSIGSLSSARSLLSLYIDPLISILDHQNPPLQFQNSTTGNIPINVNGVFETNPAASLNLVIDVKSNGTATFPLIIQQLQSLRSRGYLTYFNGSSLILGPITVIATGNAPFDLLTSNTSHRDIFFDAPLDQFWGDDDDESIPLDSNNAERYTYENSYYASVDFAKAIGKPWHGSLAPRQVDTIMVQARAAAARGLKARYWNTPAWPVGVRDHVWDVLEREGVGMLNVDDFVGASRRNWGG